MGVWIVTNNPLARDRLSDGYEVEYLDCTFHQVLLRLRDLVHKGHRLLTHPLSGSIKPNETPYKSVLISREAGRLDFESLALIENSLITCEKFRVKFPEMPDAMRRDFQLLDFTLLQSAL